MAGGDVVENQFIRPVILIFPGLGDGIAGIDVIEEFNSLDHAATIYVQTWDNSFSKAWSVTQLISSLNWDRDAAEWGLHATAAFMSGPCAIPASSAAVFRPEAGRKMPVKQPMMTDAEKIGFPSLWWRPCRHRF